MPSIPTRRLATIEDALSRPEHERVELVRGTLVQKAAPTAEHGLAQAGLAWRLKSGFHRRPGARWPGSWWILTEVDVLLGSELFRPDVVGWRRERCPLPPSGRPVELRPDWICEVLPPSTENIDRVDKLQSYFAAGVPHYWLANPLEKVLEVLRRTDLAYALVLTAKAGQRVRAEPFETEELAVDELLAAIRTTTRPERHGSSVVVP